MEETPAPYFVMRIVVMSSMASYYLKKQTVKTKLFAVVLWTNGN